MPNIICIHKYPADSTADIEHSSSHQKRSEDTMPSISKSADSTTIAMASLLLEALDAAWRP